MRCQIPVSYTHLDVYKRQAKDFVQVEKHYEPDPVNRKIYNDLFDDYKNVYYALEGAYIKANGDRFKGEEQ